MSEEIKNRARELLRSGSVDVVIGYKRASDGISAKPCFVFREPDASVLIFDDKCTYNLSNYIKDFAGKKIGIIAKPADIKAITVLRQEKQLKPEDIIIIEAGTFRKTGDAPEQAGTLDERAKAWEEEFSLCIRCYACRQICPMCYCPTCVADQTMPQWFSKAVNLKGNFSWNVTRAMHLAGRCIGCGECERACPAGIPLMKINRKIEKDVMELFNYEAGASPEQKPLLACFNKNDPQDFIK